MNCLREGCNDGVDSYVGVGGLTRLERVSDGGGNESEPDEGAEDRSELHDEGARRNKGSIVGNVR
jgi:hypothetical protein